MEQEKRFELLKNLRKLKKLWVDELEMGPKSFQEAIEKMMSYQIRWIGGRTDEASLFAKVIISVSLCASEFDGEVMAHVFMGQTGRSGKVPFLSKGRFFLAIFQEHYTVVIEDNYLNVNELIFWMDNKKCCDADLGTDVNVCDYL